MIVLHGYPVPRLIASRNQNNGCNKIIESTLHEKTLRLYTRMRRARRSAFETGSACVTSQE